MNYLISINIFLFDLFLFKLISMLLVKKQQFFYFDKKIVSNVSFYDLKISVLFKNIKLEGKKLGNSYYFIFENKIMVVNKLSEKIYFITNEKNFNINIEFGYIYNSINKKNGELVLLNNNKYLFNCKNNFKILKNNNLNINISKKLFISKYSLESLILENEYFDSSFENTISKIKYIFFKGKKYFFKKVDFQKITAGFGYLINKQIYNYAYFYSALNYLKGDNLAINLYLLFFILKVKFFNNRILFCNKIPYNFTIFLEDDSKISFKKKGDNFIIEKNNIKFYNFNAIEF